MCGKCWVSSKWLLLSFLPGRKMFLPLKMKESWDDVHVLAGDQPSSAPVYVMLREHLNVSDYGSKRKPCLSLTYNMMNIEGQLVKAHFCWYIFCNAVQHNLNAERNGTSIISFG